MALFEEIESPEVPPELDPINVKTQPYQYDGICIDTRYQASSNIQLWIGGSNWVVEYFSQVLGGTVEPSVLDLSRKPIYQTYRRIKKLPLKVSRALEGSHTENIDRFSLTGGGFTFPFLTPQLNDMFIANIGDGKLGLFTITSRRRETHLRDSTYAVEWKMLRELTKADVDNLTLKSKETLYFDMDSLGSGCGPFISAESFYDRKELDRVYKQIVRNYITDFFSSQFRTMIVPDQLETVYDHFATKAFISMIGPSVDTRMRECRELNVQSEPVMKQPTVWDALIRMDAARSYDATERAHLVPTRISRWRPELQAIGFTGVKRFVFPIDAPTDVDSQYDLEDRYRPMGTPFREGRPRRPELTGYTTQAERDAVWFRRIAPELEASVEPWTIPADIHPIVRDTHYVFTEPFYRCDSKLQSKLEMLTKQMINREALNMEQLKSVISHCFDWDNLERYYYHIVLLAVIAYAKGAKINAQEL